MSRRNVATAAFVIVAWIAITAAQAKTFNVRVAVGPPAQARSGAVLDTVSYAPFDDSTNSLYDGVDTYYTVEDVDGGPVQISVGKNLVLGAVRLGFDDGDPQSADVDAANSQVVVEPSTIPADSVTAATVVVTPLDSSGVFLGAGLKVTLDTNALLPGVVAGTVQDNVDGTYTVRVIALSSGEGTVVVNVEGWELDAKPSITYEFVPLSTQQQDLLQTIAELQAIIDADPGANEAGELEHAVQQLQAAVSALSETPPDRVDAVDKIRRGIEEIEQAEAAGFDAAQADGYMDRLAGIARQLAENSIADAVSFAGDSQKIDEALAALSDGDAHLALPDYAEAANAYREAAKKAKEALVRSVDPIVHKVRDGIADLESAVDRGFDPAQADGYMDRLAGVARQLVVVAVDAAVAAHGAPDKIAEALGKLGDGDSQRALPDYSTATQEYENATKKADDAAPGMTYDVLSLSGPSADLAQIIVELQAIVDADPGTEVTGKLANSIQDLLEALAALP